MSALMRAKMKVVQLKSDEYSDKVEMVAVCKSEKYPEDGSDEDNTFAKFSPSAELSITIANPALFGKLRPGQKYYVDFTLVDAPPNPTT